ncbi:unnamed protein product [Closterium sp. Yama58-4]|nr:unnamed protein product [Closterium sp. Yama58-4]
MAVSHSRLPSTELALHSRGSSPALSDHDSYLSELLSERQKLSPFMQVLPICSRLMNQEIARVTSLVGAQVFMDHDSIEHSPPMSHQPHSSHQQITHQHLSHQALTHPPHPPHQSHATHQGHISHQSQQIRPSSSGSPFDSGTWAPMPSEVGPSSSLFLMQPTSQPSASGTLVGWTAQPGAAPIVKKTSRLEVPVDKYPTFNFVGRILGPRGNSLKRVEAQTGCRVLIRGRGSIKDAGKEEKMRDKPGFEHLNEPLHVIVEAELPANVVDAQLAQACEILQELLRPVDETHDVVKPSENSTIAITWQASTLKPTCLCLRVNIMMLFTSTACRSWGEQKKVTG